MKIKRQLKPFVIFKPCVQWHQPATQGPYERWKNLQVSVGTVRDSCGCSLRRFREHCQSYPQRFGMYYELVDEIFEGTREAQRSYHTGNSTSFVIKLYAPRQGFGKVGFTQAAFNHELVWVSRPCEVHGRKLTDRERRGCGAVPPQHMIEYFKKKGRKS